MSTSKPASAASRALPTQVIRAEGGAELRADVDAGGAQVVDFVAIILAFFAASHLVRGPRLGDAVCVRGVGFRERIDQADLFLTGLVAMAELPPIERSGRPVWIGSPPE